MTSTLRASMQRASRPAKPAALLFSGAVAGFGLGALILALTLPAPEVAALPPLAANPRALSVEPSESPASRPWAAAFGLAPAPVAIEPLEETEGFASLEPYLDDEDDFNEPFSESEYLLRGLVNEQGGGWALIEGEMGIEVVRVGSVLSGGETVVEITADGVILQGYGAEFLLSFSEFDAMDDDFHLEFDD